MTTTHHGLRWGPVKPVKVTAAPTDAASPELPTTMAEALAKVHQPSRGGWCVACWQRWPCDTAELCEEWHGERRRVEQLEDAIRLFHERVREWEALSVRAVYIAEIEAIRTELIVRQEALFSLVEEKES